MLVLLAIAAWAAVAVTDWGFLASVKRRLHIPKLEVREVPGSFRRGLDWVAVHEVVVLSLVVLYFAAESYHLGADRTYDLLNYHFVNGYLALHPGVQTIGASGIQGFFNPIIDVPTYLGYRYLSGGVVLFGFGLIQGLAFPAFYKVARAMDFGRLTSYFAAGCGLFSAISMSEMGFSLGDTTLVPLVAVALLLVLRATPIPRTATPLILAGTFVGISTGLKLTTAPYLIGIVAFVWFFTVRGEKLRSAVLTVVGGAIGGLLSYGYWAWHLFHLYRNPFFPMFNQYFHSQYATVGLNNGVDDRVHGIFQFLFFSYEIILHPIRTGAGAMHDLGFPLVETLLIVTLGWWAVRSIRARHVEKFFNRRETRAMVALYLASYVVWVETTGIFRYMAALEMLAFLMVAVLLRDFGMTLHREKIVPWAIAASFAFISLTQLSPIWFPRMAALSSEFNVTLPPMLSQPGTSVVFADGSPNTWIVPFLPSSDFVTRVYNWSITPAMATLIESKISTTGSPVVVWTDKSNITVVNARIALVHLHVDSANCATFQATAGNLVPTFAACRATTLSGG